MPTAAVWRTSTPTRIEEVGGNVTRLAGAALLREMNLTPKPGLVDRANSGAHHDMNLATFRASAAAIAPWLAVFFQRGVAHSTLAAADFLALLRADGLACERAMLRATDGVNTHKGSIFAFGLLCAAAGRLAGRCAALGSEPICAEVATLCAGLVSRELRLAKCRQTAGERLFAEHGLSGARGEAQSGFATARSVGVPPYQLALALGLGEERALLEALLHLMARNPDTNLAARGGLDGLALVQSQARQLLLGPLPTTAVRMRQLQAFDQLLIEQHLSPGGSADLLAVSWFLAQLDASQGRTVDTW
jgi:triphosphoribosyl-dephospho-CoA synthase